MTNTAAFVSVVLPTRNEADNIVEVLERLDAPPEVVPALIERRGGADLAIASRFNWESVSESKAGAREAIRYGRHLLDLRRRVRAGSIAERAEPVSVS